MPSRAGVGFEQKNASHCEERVVAVDKLYQLLLLAIKRAVVPRPGLSPRKVNHDFDPVCH
jgi:hypothetical protein